MGLTYCHGYIMLTTFKPENHGSENREHFNYTLDITCVSFMIIIRIFFQKSFKRLLLKTVLYLADPDRQQKTSSRRGLLLARDC